LEPEAEYHPPDSRPKLVAAVVDVETTGTNPDRDKIIELGICLFEYDRQTGRIYRVLGSWEWLEDPGFSIPPEITKITGITDQMVAGHRIDDGAVNDLLGRVVLVIALSWNRRDCPLGGYGRETPPLRRKIFSRPEVTPGVPESLGDRDAGIAMCQTPIGRQRCRGSEQM
jgi:Exonuclease